MLNRFRSDEPEEGRIPKEEEQIDLANAIDLSESEQEEELEDIVHDFALDEEKMDTVSRTVLHINSRTKQYASGRERPTRETAHATYGGHRSHDNAGQAPRGWHPVIPIFSPHCFPRQRVTNHWCTFAHEPASGRC